MSNSCLKQGLTPKETFMALAIWFTRKREEVSGWDLDDLAKMDANEMTEEEFKDLVSDFNPLQQAVFLGLENSYHFFAELAADESLTFSKAKKEWFELLSFMYENAARIPPHHWQEVIEA